MRWWLLYVHILASATVLLGDYTVDLQNPIFQDGTMTTQEGGVIEGPNLRIQARHIEYTNKIQDGKPLHQVVAWGDLLVEYHRQWFIGERLTYDFVYQTGSVFEGRSAMEDWFIGGSRTELLPDGSFCVEKAYLTTVESTKSWWRLQCDKVEVSKQRILSAHSSTIRLGSVPIFWIPAFRVDLTTFHEVPIRYKFLWDQILKQKAVMRYRWYADDQLQLFTRLDYRWNKGPGAAIETEYTSPGKQLSFQTKSYGAFDKLHPAEWNTRRYRLQGICHAQTSNYKTKFHLCYDKMSDEQMVQEFRSDEFEQRIRRRTFLSLAHQTNFYSAQCRIQPRVNSFQTINQQLPLLQWAIRPFSIPHTGILLDGTASIGYLDYTYATSTQKLHPCLRNVHSGRLEGRTTLYRPFHFGSIHCTPTIGWMGIGYTHKDREHRLATSQVIGMHRVDLHTDFYRNYSSFQHTLTPYCFYYSHHLLAGAPRHYIFDIQDGDGKQTLLCPGIRQTWHTSKSWNLLLDLSTRWFFLPASSHSLPPKVYLQSAIETASLKIMSQIVCQIPETKIDQANIRSEWTASEGFASILEFRHRSRYAWRKADAHNFTLDFLRTQEQLLASPLSDRRHTLLSKFRIRLTPLWNCYFESHHGWGRKEEPRYDSYQIRLTTFLTGKWELEVGYTYTPSTREWVFPSIKLINAKF